MKPFYKILFCHRDLIITYFIAAVWFINGLFCKMLDLVPRHELIVARILGNDHSGAITAAIGVAETAMALWIISGAWSRVNAIAQVIAVATMNIIEFILAPDLLLWGKLNSLFALLFIGLILYNEFYLNKKTGKKKVAISFLQNHPFAVEAFFESSIVITFAVPREELVRLLPPCLELDTFNDKWGFIAVAMVQTRDLRPKGFPRFTGNDFFLIGYRVFVRYTNNKGKNLRGLYILKSETDKKRMEIMGNIFTHYDYSTTDINQLQTGHIRDISSKKSGFEVSIDTNEGEVPLPEQSPFRDWKEARRFAGPLPFTFTFNADKSEVLTIEGVRQNWKPRPIRVIDYHFSVFDQLNIKQAVLANAFIVENIPYHWKQGKREPWKRKENPSRVY